MQHLQPLQVNHELHAALDLLEHGNQHVFITGKAGTGKSTLLSLFRNTSRKRVAVVAPTGVAALNVRGQTIHSFFRLPPRMISTGEIRRQKNYRLYEKLDVLVIDEISMVRADLLDNIDVFLRINRRNDAPFGGVRLILFGDLFQLPPVVSSEFERKFLDDKYDSIYFFSSQVWQKISEDVEVIELHTVYRQSQTYFIRILDHIRRNTLDEEDLLELNLRTAAMDEQLEDSIVLTTRNDRVRQINSARLDEIEAPLFVYPGEINDHFDHKSLPTSSLLRLKTGAQVMMLRNDPQKRFVNGSLGKVISLESDHIRVEIIDHSEKEIVDLDKYTWESIRYRWDSSKKRIETDVIGSFTQYPLKLAWAVTIHKSQGKSFDRVYIDMGKGAFAYGQTYVALSRCRSLEGLQFARPLRYSDILVDERIADFYQHWR